MAQQHKTPAELELCEGLARRSGTDAADWYCVLKARYGMEVAFKAMGEGQVATQLYTCITAVNPIIAAGMTPVYSDVDDFSLCLGPEAVIDWPCARAFVYQHTFGLAALERGRALAKAVHEAGAVLMEDSAHCVGHLATDEQGLPLADISIHSFGVEKMLPTHFGGAVWVNPKMANEKLGLAIRAALEALPQPSGKLERACSGYLNQTRVLNRLPRTVAAALRSRLVSSGRYEPAIADVELNGGVSHDPMLPGEWVAKRASSALALLDTNEQARITCVSHLREALAGVEGVHVIGEVAQGDAQPLLRLPVLVDGDADAAVARVRAAGAFAEAWYRPLLFPGAECPETYGVPADLSFLPTTQDLSARIVCLPTDVPDALIPSVVEALRG